MFAVLNTNYILSLIQHILGMLDPDSCVKNSDLQPRPTPGIRFINKILNMVISVQDPVSDLDPN
jgi:hypothetical protein